MKKILCTLMMAGLFVVMANAQQATDKKVLADADTKAALVSQLSLSEQAADKIIEIENEFYASAAAANFDGQKTEAARKAAKQKLHDTHVLRRSKLTAIPLTGRQMEDAISISEAARRKHKL